MITSFVKHLTQCHKNTICIDFQVYNPKLIQEGCFKMYIYHKKLCTRCSAKEAIDSCFCKVLYRKWWKHYCIAFQFYNQKSSLEGCFKPYVYYTRLCTGYSTTEQLIASFVEHFIKKIMKTSVCFQFYISKLSQETCFIRSLLYGIINRVLYEKRHW